MLVVLACRPRRARELRLVDLVTPTTNIENINHMEVHNPPYDTEIIPPENKSQYSNAQESIHAQRDVINYF